MHVVMIGNDPSLVGGPQLGDAVTRHQVYAQHVDHLTIISYTDSSLTEEFDIAHNAVGIPSQSKSKFHFIFDAFRIAESVHKKNPITVLVAQDPFIFGYVALRLKRKYGIPVQVNFHGDYWENSQWRRERLLNYFFLWLSYFVVKRADAVRVVSERIREKLLKHYVAKEKIFVINTPIDTERYKPLRSLGKDLIFVGRLVKAKNILFTLEVFSQISQEFPNTTLHIIGDGPLREEVESYIQQHSLTDRVVVYGVLNPDDRDEILAHARALLLLSTNESFGKVIVEAGCMMIPSIASATTGAQSIIKDGVTGLLVPLNDVAKSVQAIREILKPGVAERLGRQARDMYISHYNFSSSVQNIVDVWKKIASKNL